MTGAGTAPAPPRSRRRTGGLAATVAGLIAGLVLTGCGTAPAAEGGFVSGDGSITRIAPGQREPAPVLAGTDLDGDPLDSSAFAGTIVVYNVWGSWCAPCRAEAGALVKAAARTDGTAQFIGINTRDLDPGPARAFVRTHDIGFPSFYDPRGELLLLFGGVLSPSAIPTTLVVDAEGRMAARVLGEVSEATLVGLITEISEGR